MSDKNNNKKRVATPISGVASSSVDETIQGQGGDVEMPQVSVNRSPGGGIQMGAEIMRVTDFDLAICLISAGVPLRAAKGDPPYTHAKLKNGQHRWVWNFHNTTADGKDKTKELIAAYSQSLKYINENPDCAFTGAMCALQNRALILAHMKKSKPWIGYRNPGSASVRLVIEGSRRARVAVNNGMVRCDPFEEQKNQLEMPDPNNQ